MALYKVLASAFLLVTFAVTAPVSAVSSDDALSACLSAALDSRFEEECEDALYCYLECDDEDDACREACTLDLRTIDPEAHALFTQILTCYNCATSDEKSLEECTRGLSGGSAPSSAADAGEKKDATEGSGSASTCFEACSVPTEDSKVVEAYDCIRQNGVDCLFSAHCKCYTGLTSAQENKLGNALECVFDCLDLSVTPPFAGCPCAEDLVICLETPACAQAARCVKDDIAFGKCTEDDCTMCTKRLDEDTTEDVTSYLKCIKTCGGRDVSTEVSDQTTTKAAKTTSTPAVLPGANTTQSSSSSTFTSEFETAFDSDTSSDPAATGSTSSPASSSSSSTIKPPSDGSTTRSSTTAKTSTTTKTSTFSSTTTEQPTVEGCIEQCDDDIEQCEDSGDCEKAINFVLDSMEESNACDQRCMVDFGRSLQGKPRRNFNQATSCLQRCLRLNVVPVYSVRAKLYFSSISLQQVLANKEMIEDTLEERFNGGVTVYSIRESTNTGSKMRRAAGDVEVEYGFYALGNQEKNEAKDDVDQLNSNTGVKALLSDLEAAYASSGGTDKTNPFKNAHVYGSAASTSVDDPTSSDDQQSQRHGAVFTGGMVGAATGVLLLIGIVMYLRFYRRSGVRRSNAVATAMPKSFDNPAFSSRLADTGDSGHYQEPEPFDSDAGGNKTEQPARSRQLAHPLRRDSVA